MCANTTSLAGIQRAWITIDESLCRRFEDESTKRFRDPWWTSMTCGSCWLKELINSWWWGQCGLGVWLWFIALAERTLEGCTFRSADLNNGSNHLLTKFVGMWKIRKSFIFTRLSLVLTVRKLLWASATLGSWPFHRAFLLQLYPRCDARQRI